MRRASGTPRERTPIDRQLLDAAVPLDDLVGDAHQRARNPIGVHYDWHGDLLAALGGDGTRGPGTGDSGTQDRALVRLASRSR